MREKVRCGTQLGGTIVVVVLRVAAVLAVVAVVAVVAVAGGAVLLVTVRSLLLVVVGC